MKIVVVSHDADFTGAPRIAFDIACELAKEHDLRLVSKREGPLIGLPKYSNIVDRYTVTRTSHVYGSIPFNERVRRAVVMLGDLKPDLLYANSCGSSEWCVAAHLLGIPAVLHTHEMAQGLMSLSAADVLKFDIPRYIDLLISASQEATDDFLELTCGSVPRHFLFGIMIDISYIKSMAEESVVPPKNLSGRQLSKDKPIVAMCGFATERKGFDIFYETAKGIPEADFLWIGPVSGDATASQVMHAYNAERTDNFFVTGETPNPYAYIGMCDIFALTSIEDPNPLVVPEALALGKRVVSFQNTGGSWRWTRTLGYSLSGAISSDRLTSFLRRMIRAPRTAGWMKAQSSELEDAVDLNLRLPALRQQLSDLVGAPV